MSDGSGRRNHRIAWINVLIGTILSLALLSQPGGRAEVAADTPAVKTNSDPAVVLGDAKLFPVQTGIGSFSAEFRAEVISKRITEFAQALNQDTNSLKITNNEKTATTDITSADGVMMTIADVDAVAAGASRQELAQQHLATIQRSVRAYRKAYSPRSILQGAIFTIIATLVLITSFTLITRSTPKLHRQLRRMQGDKIRGLKIIGNQILSARRFVDLIIECLRFLRLAVLLLIFYAYINLTLSFFPWTKGLSLTLFSYLVAALGAIGSGILGYLPNLFFLGLIILITSYTLKIFRFLFTEIENGTIQFTGFYPEWAQPTYKLVQIIILAFAATVSFPYLPGSATPAFQGISIFLGVLVSLGSSTAVANTIAGIILTYTRAFRIGDRIQIEDTTGDVVNKTLFVTRLRTIKNVVITIPNSTVLGSHVINYSGASVDEETLPLILHAVVTIGYDVPWRDVHRLLVKSAIETNGVLAEPSPFVLQKSLDDFYVSYEVNAYSENASAMARTYSELYQNIQDNFAASQIEIMSPHYRAMRDGSQITIPADTETPIEAP